MSVSRTVSEIFNVKEWRDLENVSCSKSLKIGPFKDRSHTTVCWSAIVNIALSCTVFELYVTLNNIVTLKSGLEITRGH